MHVAVNRRASRAGVGIVSQKDMSITLFIFMGFQVLMPDKFGIVGTREQFEAFNHFWRVVGFMLGTHDKFNCCGETLDDTLGRLEAIRVGMMLPELLSPSPEYVIYTRTVVDGMWHFDTLDSYYDSLMFITKRAVGVAGYHYFANVVTGKQKAVLQSFSRLTKLKIFFEIAVYEYLSQVFIFRWLFNIVRVSFAVLDAFPFFGSVQLWEESCLF